MVEQWKDIEGFEGVYVIFNTGKIKSFIRGERWLKCREGDNGWRSVVLTKDGELFNYKLHRLVAYHFLDNPNDWSGVRCIKHKDDCSVTNVEWVENAQDRKAPREFLLNHYEETKNEFYPMQKMMHKYFITGDGSYISYIFTRSYDKWLGYIIKNIKNKPEAQDLLQDCYGYFTDAIDEGRFRIDRCFVDYAPDTFIFAIIKNQVCNWHKKDKKILVGDFWEETEFESFDY